MDNWKLLMMQETDLEEVEQLEQQCFTEPWSSFLLSDILKNSYDFAWVIKKNKELVAYCNLRIIAGEGEIMRIAVLPAYRRQGFARKLMEEMLEFAKEQNCEALLLEVRESNRSARTLYESYGFQIDGIRKEYYEHPKENAVLMGLRLV